MFNIHKLPQPQAACCAAIDDRIVEIARQSILTDENDQDEVLERIRSMREFSYSLIPYSDWPSNRRQYMETLISRIEKLI